MSCRRNCDCQCGLSGCGCHDGEDFSTRVIEIRVPFYVDLAVKIIGGLVVLASIVQLVRKVRR